MYNHSFSFGLLNLALFFARWLTEELGIDPDEITFIEDVWAGGGNLGPSIEYFVGGLELGNMVRPHSLAVSCTHAVIIFAGAFRFSCNSRLIQMVEESHSR